MTDYIGYNLLCKSLINFFGIKFLWIFGIQETWQHAK
jgi:hypothetical protein